jgi:hypothetical protein
MYEALPSPDGARHQHLPPPHVPFIALLVVCAAVGFLVSGRAVLGLAAGVGALFLPVFGLLIAAVNDWRREVEVVDAWLSSLNEALRGLPTQDRG